ncbi:PREDICTED: cell division cycle-associated protein 7-like [Dinoponera quadriceps]|uniref:Cell division cycle-associated protein 7-like n=1 Tax=Dinoponera quadriceps TaxID=609295 RepID=A0A6P3WUF2_DINQU|nr:PREDICTED: cell division cycle-associated protein 7-like [Dinoponera quadriceps]
MDEDDYSVLRQKNISERNAFFAEFLKDLKEETNEIRKIRKEQWNKDESENQPPKKRRRTISEDSENFHGSGIRLQFRRKYNTRSSKRLSNIDGSNNSDNEDEETELLENNRSRGLKILFPWAKPFQRSIDLMKIVCDVDEENKDDEEYSDDDFNDNARKRKRFIHRAQKQYDPDNIPSVDEITESMLRNVAKKSSKKTYCKIKGTSCHQCRQKTLDTKTVCRSGECVGVRGQFCGPCLRGRYGESAVEALKDPSWACPPCRGLCNCSICRTRDGLVPTGILAPQAQNVGYSSVKDYLQAQELQDI